MRIKYRIPTWRLGYYIYCEDNQWYNESGTRVCISGWKSVLDEFEPYFDEDYLLPQFGSCLQKYLFKPNIESIRKSMTDEIIKVIDSLGVYKVTMSVDVQLSEDGVIHISIEKDDE